MLALRYHRFDGSGLAKFKNGDGYAGSFHSGLMHGEGKYTWKDGTTYQGTFVFNEVSLS